MEFKTQCTEDNQDATGLHHITLRDVVSGHTVTFSSQTKCEKGEEYAVTVTGKGLDEPAPEPEPAPVPESAPDKFDAQPTP
jgi:hypothetical protein